MTAALSRRVAATLAALAGVLEEAGRLDLDLEIELGVAGWAADARALAGEVALAAGLTPPMPAPPTRTEE